MRTTDFTVEELNMQGAYNGNRYLYKFYHYDKDRVVAKSNTAVDMNDHSNCGMITFPTPVDNEQLPIAELATYLDRNFKQWVIGNFIHGWYSKLDKIFDAAALSVVISDITSAELTETAKELCNLYGKNCALVKNCSENTLFFILADSESR